MKTSLLERTWWFVAIVSALAILSTTFLMHAAGLAYPYTGVAQWTLFALCFAVFQRGFSGAGWLLAVMLKPASPVLERQHEK